MSKRLLCILFLINKKTYQNEKNINSVFIITSHYFMW